MSLGALGVEARVVEYDSGNRSIALVHPFTDSGQRQAVSEEIAERIDLDAYADGDICAKVDFYDTLNENWSSEITIVEPGDQEVDR